MNLHLPSSAPVVLLGGTGKTGRRVAERLSSGDRPVRTVSRSTPIPFDWHGKETWRQALNGAGAMYITYQPDLAVPGASDHVAEVCALAVALGIRRIVLLAGRGEPQVHPAELAVRQAGVDYTILECAFFAQNFDEGLLAPQGDTVFFPGGSTAEPFIDCDDIADVAVAALTDDQHVGRTYDLTGPACLTFGEATSVLSSVWEMPLQYISPSFEDYAKALTNHMSKQEADFLCSLFAYLLDGHNSHTTGDVERVLGRPATNFATFARRAANSRRQLP